MPVKTKKELPPNGMPESKFDCSLKTYGELPIGATVEQDGVKYIVEQGLKHTTLNPLDKDFPPLDIKQKELTPEGFKIVSLPEPDALPMNGAKNPMKQKDITGKKDLHITPPLEVLQAADDLLNRKVQLSTAKTNADEAATALIRIMDRYEMTQVTVTDGGVKKRIIIRQGEEKLKVEKAND